MPASSFAQQSAIRSRLRSLFERQRGGYLSYLDLLDRQREAISEQDAGRLSAHVHAEGLLVEQLTALQKVAAALEEPYRRWLPGGDAAVEALREELTGLRERTLAANARNRGLLAAEMERLQRRIRGLRLGRRVFSPHAPQARPSMIDITA